MKNSKRFTRPSKKEADMGTTVVLLAGNLGYRMTTFGPQCLQKLSNGDFLLDHQVKTIKECLPRSEIIITCRDYIQKMVRHKPDGVRLVESKLEDTNEVEEIRLAINNCTTDNMLFIQSDTFFEKNVLKGLDFSRSFVIFETKGMMRHDSVGVTVVNSKATIMSYAVDKKWGRIFNINKTAKKSLNNFCRNDAHKKMYAHEALNYVMDKCPVYAIETKDLLYCVDRIDDVEGLGEI